MNNKTLMKILSICFLVVMAFNFTGNIYAAVNSSYQSDDMEVVEVDLEKKMKNSILLDAIASLVYALGSLVESLTGTVFELLTGTNMFPWADRVIFNSVPFLDINFLNPANGSLFVNQTGGDTILANIVRNTYYTILIISIGFLGIIVGVMAVRLAISTIASEKAKYKEAIVKFLVSLVMLFCVHYAISFIFYLNESLVEIASNILANNLEEVEFADDFLKDNLTDKEIITNFFEKQEGIIGNFDKERDEILSEEQSTRILAALLKSDIYKDVVIPEAFGNDQGSKVLQWFEKILGNSSFLGLGFNNWLVGDKDVIKKIQGSVNYVKEISENEKKRKVVEDLIKDLEEDPKGYYEENTGFFAGLFSDYDDWYKKERKELIKLNKLYLQIAKGNNNISPVTPQNFIAKLGQYFKESAWTIEVDEDGDEVGWAADQISLQGALLYAIFVVQSMLYFVAYIKRFFFVVILALLAPIIVLYDFLGKAIM